MDFFISDKIDRIHMKNSRNFGPKSQFCTKIDIFVKNIDPRKVSIYCLQIETLVKDRNF